MLNESIDLNNNVDLEEHQESGSQSKKLNIDLEEEVRCKLRDMLNESIDLNNNIDLEEQQESERQSKKLNNGLEEEVRRMAKYGFTALSTAIAAFAGLYLRTQFTINPDEVYRMAMRRLNTSAGVRAVMGSPLVGTDLRACLMSGGGVSLKNFKLHFRSKRCFLIFPIRGSEMKGLVSVEVKNKKGQYDMKLLAVDIQMFSGPDKRIYVIGDEEEYKVGGGLISELRDPVVKAMEAIKEFEDLDQLEDEEDEERERQ